MYCYAVKYKLLKIYDEIYIQCFSWIFKMYFSIFFRLKKTHKNETDFNLMYGDIGKNLILNDTYFCDHVVWVSFRNNSNIKYQTTFVNTWIINRLKLSMFIEMCNQT